MDLYQFSKGCFCLGCMEKQCYKRSYQTQYRQHGHYRQYTRRISRNHNKGLWRPWTEEENRTSINQECQWNQFENKSLAIQSVPQFNHPVKLVWPKKPYDYMFAEGEKLLRDFPVQATLEFVSDADSDSEDDDYDVDPEDNSLTMVTSTTDVVEKK
ncbi:protein ripply2.1-like isoform X2 [Rhopilema esculentum]|uniref:protein ripply2.1-like isoform X2 n=2 Tax=Rhopilema esculentum TaxID=499914 RepID=UPI0031D3D9FE